MMYHLLTGPCGQLASNRVTAIKEGRSVSSYFESLADGSEDKESVKEKIDDEIKSALDAGLNFNVRCNLGGCFPVVAVILFHCGSLFCTSFCKLIRSCAIFGCMTLVSLKTH